MTPLQSAHFLKSQHRAEKQLKQGSRIHILNALCPLGILFPKFVHKSSKRDRLVQTNM